MRVVGLARSYPEMGSHAVAAQLLHERERLVGGYCRVHVPPPAEIDPVKVEVSDKYQTVTTLVQQYVFIPCLLFLNKNYNPLKKWPLNKFTTEKFPHILQLRCPNISITILFR